VQLAIEKELSFYWGFIAAHEAFSQFEEYEAICKQKIRKLEDEGNFLRSVFLASNEEWSMLKGQARPVAVDFRQPLQRMGAELESAADQIEATQDHLKCLLKGAFADLPRHEFVFVK
jgi:hypothetical protein